MDAVDIERRFGGNDLQRAKTLLRRATGNTKIDWPEKIFETWLELEGDLQDGEHDSGNAYYTALARIRAQETILARIRAKVFKYLIILAFHLF